MRTLALLLCSLGVPWAPALAQRYFPIEAPLKAQLFEAWVAPLPSPVRLFLEVKGTETYPSDSSCMATDVQRVNQGMRVVVLGRQLCPAATGRPPRDGEDLPRTIVPVQVSGIYRITIVSAGDSTVFLVRNDHKGYTVAAVLAGAMANVPRPIPAIDPYEGIVTCVPQPGWELCDTYFKLLLVRGQLRYGYDLASYFGQYSYPPYYSPYSRVDSASLRNQRTYGVIEAGSLGRMIAFTEEFIQATSSRPGYPTIRVQFTTGMGLRYLCELKCTETVLNSSMDATSPLYYKSEP